MSWFLLFALVALGITAFASIGTMVLNEIAWHELEEYCKSQKRPERFGEIFEIRDEMEVGCGFLELIASVIMATSIFFYFWGYRHEVPPTFVDFMFLATLLGITLLLANQWIPWAVTQLSAPQFLYRTWRFWWLVSLLGWPVVAGRNFFQELFARASGSEEIEESEGEAFEDEILSMVSEGEQDGFLEPNTRDMIEGVMELDDKTVAHVMTSRNDVDTLDLSASWDEMMEFVIQSGRTRIPIFDGSPDQIVGLLYAKDLLRESRRSKRRPLQKLLRDPIEVPESKMLNAMLKTFLHGRTHMAIVKDEYGGLAGVVTIEDVLEEIVGEIVDETDKDKSGDITILNPLQADVRGTIHIDVLNDEMGIELPEDEEFATVSGLIMSQINEVPRSGHELVVGNIQFNILEATRRQIQAVRVTIREEEN
jgi:CBS domain containing-hemolysin-like protein